MCGIFGYISDEKNVETNIIKKIILESKKRGRDSSGIVSYDGKYRVSKIDQDIDNLLPITNIDSSVVFGHTRLITNGFSDNQPVVKGSICAVHNGIITNTNSLWNSIDRTPELTIDSEIIVDFFYKFLEAGLTINQIADKLLSSFEALYALEFFFQILVNLYYLVIMAAYT